MKTLFLSLAGIGLLAGNLHAQNDRPYKPQVDQVRVPASTVLAQLTDSPDRKSVV